MVSRFIWSELHKIASKKKVDWHWTSLWHSKDLEISFRTVSKDIGRKNRGSIFCQSTGSKVYSHTDVYKSNSPAFPTFGFYATVSRAAPGKRNFTIGKMKIYDCTSSPCVCYARWALFHPSLYRERWTGTSLELIADGVRYNAKRNIPILRLILKFA